MRRHTMMLAVAISVAGLMPMGEAGAARLGVKAKIARRVERSPRLKAAKTRFEALRTSRADRTARNRGRALADVHRTGRTRVRTVGDVLFHPVLHGAIAFGAMTLLGVDPQMSLIAGGLVYFSSRSAKKTSDGWLELENKTIDVLERDGPDAVQKRFRRQGARRPEQNLAKLQRNRHLRNQHYDD